MYHISPTDEIKEVVSQQMVKQRQQIGSQKEYQQPGPNGNKILNQLDMQSTEAQGARVRTSTSRTSSTRSTRDQVPHIAITISGMDCTFAKETQPPTNVATQTWTLSPTTQQTRSATPQSAGTKRKRHDPEQPIKIENSRDHQAKQSSPPYPEISQHDSQRGTRGQHGLLTKPTTTKGVPTSMKIRRGQSLRHRRATPFVRTAAPRPTQDRLAL